mgnify:CR=1 FL=1
MKLKDYFDQTGETYSALGQRVEASSQNIGRIVRGLRQASPALALRIERATDGAVTRQELRPDIYPPDEVEEA